MLYIVRFLVLRMVFWLFWMSRLVLVSIRLILKYELFLWVMSLGVCFMMCEVVCILVMCILLMDVLWMMLWK